MEREPKFSVEVNTAPRLPGFAAIGALRATVVFTFPPLVPIILFASVSFISVPEESKSISKPFRFRMPDST